MSAGSLAIDVTASTASLQAAMTQGANVTDREMKRVQRAVEYATTVLKAMEKAQRTANGAAADQARTSQVAERVADQARKAGISVGQMNSALRNTPAQISDIATQLAGGQSPFLVMTQQGLQMRDMFGGFGGMFRGLSTMISPVGVALGATAAASGAVAFAFAQASKEQESFNRAMALTNGYAGVTNAGLTAVAERVARTSSVTVGAARDIGQALVQTGRVGPGALEGMSLAVAKLQALSGESAESLVKDFARMRDGVAKWAAEHNKQYHFITLAEYKQIEAAEKAGDVNKAVDLTLSSLNGKLQESKSGWTSLTQAVSGYWESLKKAVGPSSNEDKVSDLRAQLNALRNRDGNDAYSSYRQRVVTVAQQREMILGQIQALQDKANAERAAAEAAAAGKAKEEAAIDVYVKGQAKAKQAMDQMQSAYEARKQSLGEEAIRLHAQSENWKRYGKAIDDTALATLNLEIAQGKLKGTSAGRVKELQNLAAKVDQQRMENALQQQAATAAAKAQAALDAYTASKAQHTLTIDREIAQMQAEAESIGRTTQEREVATAAIKIHAQAQEMVAKHTAQAADAAAWEAEQVAKVTAAIERRNALKNDPQAGVQTAVTKYMEDAANAAKYAENLVSGGLQRMEDGFINLLHTGKASFGSLFQFMADEFIRQQLRMLVSGQLSGAGGLGGLLGAMFGGRSSVSTTPGSTVQVSDTPQISPTFAATGYDYVPRDNTPFMLHEGEGVLTRAENAAMRSGGTGQVHVVNHIGQGVNRAEVTAAIYQAMAAVEARILSSKAHRGRFA
jgi:lambda family phage tail tape measure protein